MSAVKIGINGFGRIGRMTFRAVMQQHMRDKIEIAVINDPATPAKYAAYQLEHDSIHGKPDGCITYTERALVVDAYHTRVFAHNNPADVPWDDYGVDYVIECSGLHRSEDACEGHLKAGNQRVIIADMPSDDSPVFVPGVNHSDYSPWNPRHVVVSAGSAGVNALAVIAKVLDDNFDIVRGLATEITPVTALQRVTDGSCPRDWRNGRSVMNNIIPSQLERLNAVSRLLSGLNGNLDGITVHVPTQDVSLLDLNVALKERVQYEDICKAMKNALYGTIGQALGYTNENVVSSDFIGNPKAAVFDERAGITLDANTFKILAWYDNEFGYASQIVNLIAHMAKADEII